MLDTSNRRLHLAQTSLQVDPKDEGLCEEEASTKEEIEGDDGDQRGGKMQE